jgi:hypothetical protein
MEDREGSHLCGRSSQKVVEAVTLDSQVRAKKMKLMG